jgi:hypothetical protein
MVSANPLEMRDPDLPPRCPQRLRETGFGTRLPTYDWKEGDLVTAVDGLLGDDPLRTRMRANAEAI